MKQKLAILGRNIAQSTTACLLAMTQGDLSTVTLDHWKIALATGTAVGLLALLFSFLPFDNIEQSKWGVAAIAFVGTFVVDAINHGSHYNLFWGDEALLTATIAAGLSILTSYTPIGILAQK
jgi:peptidoglycan/LPS O-acetylase OafA/YrhL